MRRAVTFKLEEELLEALDSLALQLGTTRTDIIKKAIKEYLRKPARTHYRRARHITIRKVVLT